MDDGHSKEEEEEALFIATPKPLYPTPSAKRSDSGTATIRTSGPQKSASFRLGVSPSPISSHF